jgi:DNA-binding IclR family transcriptional regulator
MARPLSLAELVQATGLARPTAHRLAVGLEAHRLLRRTADGRFALGFGTMELGRAAADSVPIAQVARPALIALTADVGESSQLYVEGAGRRVCVVSVQGSAELRTIVAEGAELPLDRGSAGRVLSGIVGPTGWVETIEERAAGVASVSAPVRGPGGSVVAAVSISGPIERMGRSPGERFGDRILRTAAEIERAFSPG